MKPKTRTGPPAGPTEWNHMLNLQNEKMPAGPMLNLQNEKCRNFIQNMWNDNKKFIISSARTCWNYRTSEDHMIGWYLQDFNTSTNRTKLKKNIEINSFQLLNQLTWTDSFNHCISIAELAQLYDRTTKSLHLHCIPISLQFALKDNTSTNRTETKKKYRNQFISIVKSIDMNW